MSTAVVFLFLLSGLLLFATVIAVYATAVTARSRGVPR